MLSVEFITAALAVYSTILPVQFISFGVIHENKVIKKMMRVLCVYYYNEKPYTQTDTK